MSRVVLLSLFLFVGCVHAPPRHGVYGLGSQSLYIEDVPFFHQEQYQCGPASLAAVLNYWGEDVTPEEISAAIYLPDLKGTLTLDLWRYASSRGMDAKVEQGSLVFVESRLKEGKPVIAFLNRGYRFFPAGHFLVVVGIDPDRQMVITYSGSEKNKRIPFKKFLAFWEKTNYWSLTLTPEGKPHG